MANASMRRGSDFERLFADWLSTFVAGVDRLIKHGMNDKGDISGLEDWACELKATASFSLEGLKEAEKEAHNAGKKWYAYVWKWKGHSVGQCIVSTHAQVWAEVLEEMENLKTANRKLRDILDYMKEERNGTNG